MRELIHPVTGLRRVWGGDSESPRTGRPEAYPTMQAAQAKASAPRLEIVTAARVEAHAFSGLISPVKPDYAKHVLAGAVHGELRAQWELFSLMEDSWDRLAKNLNEVKRAVQRLDWTVKPYAERGQEPTPLAQEKADLVQAALKNWRPTPGTLEYGFEDCLYHALDAMGKGISVQEIHWGIGGTPMGARETRALPQILPRAAHQLTGWQYAWEPGPGRRRLGLREVGAIGNTPSDARSLKAAATDWQEFPANKFLVGQWHSRSGPAGATAMLRPLVPYWLGMMFGWRWLMQTAQLFGVPFRWATYDRSDPNLADTLGTMLEQMGSSGYAAFPTGTTLEFKEAVTSARDNPQVVIIEMAKKAADLLILGQELSSEAAATGLGSGTAQLQQVVREEVLVHAAAWTADVLNYQLVPALLALNYGSSPDGSLGPLGPFAEAVAECPVIVPDTSIDPDPKALADRDAVLSGIGLPLPKRWMYERHSIPEPEAGDEVISAPAVGNGGIGALATSLSLPVQAKDATDSLVDNVLEGLTGVQARWLGGVKPFFARLVKLAQDDRISDADFVQALEAAQREIPELFDKLDHEALATAMENAMGAACVNGAVKGFLKRGTGRSLELAGQRPAPQAT